MKARMLAAAAALILSTPASADFAAGRSGAGYGQPGHWSSDHRSPLERFGKGVKGARRYSRFKMRELDLQRYEADLKALRPAAARMEDSRGRCDHVLRAALDSGRAAEIQDARERCKPRLYGPYLK